MTDTTLTCDALDALLPDYLEGSLDAATTAAVDAHRTSCRRCEALIADVLAISREARALPDLVPPRDLWAGIASRIEAPVVELRRTRHAVRRMPWRLAAAAAGLVIATASVTYVATKHDLERSGAQTVAVVPPGGGAGQQPARASAAESVSSSVAPGRANPASPAVRLASREKRPVSAELTYDREIARLHALVNERRGELDTATVTVIEKNLRVIDQAIAQSRAALARDPASRFLNDQLNNALDRKVELLRTVAFLPARS